MVQPGKRHYTAWGDNNGWSFTVFHPSFPRRCCIVYLCGGIEHGYAHKFGDSSIRDLHADQHANDPDSDAYRHAAKSYRHEDKYSPCSNCYKDQNTSVPDSDTYKHTGKPYRHEDEYASFSASNCHPNIFIFYSDGDKRALISHFDLHDPGSIIYAIVCHD